MEKKSVIIRYEGGESRHGNNGVDYMLVVIPESLLTEDQRDKLDEYTVRGIPGLEDDETYYELYEEVDPRDYADAAGLTGEELEKLWADGKEAPEAISDATYEALWDMILEDARDTGIPESLLKD